MQLKILQFKHHVVCAALLLVSLWQNLHSFPGRRDSARQNVSPEGWVGGEDTGVCGNIFQSRLSLENAQKSRHRTLGKSQTHSFRDQFIALPE